MLRAKARERAAKGLFLGEGILDNPHIALSVTSIIDRYCVAAVPSVQGSGSRV